MTRIKYKEAIGIKVGTGRPSTGAKPEKEVLDKLYVQESRSIREIAEILGCKKDVVYYWLKKFGIETRTMAKRSKLLRYSLAELKDGVMTKGGRGYARELGVDESTLRHHLQVRKR
jgi:transposase